MKLQNIFGSSPLIAFLNRMLFCFFTGAHSKGFAAM